MIKRIIARLDIKNNFLVKGMHLEGLRILGYPELFSKKYFEEGIDEIIFQDVVASLYKRNQLSSLTNKISNNTFVPIIVGGGIRNIQDIKETLINGADRVSINTGAIENKKFIREAVKIFGSSTICISIETLKIENIPVKNIVLNNAHLGMVAQWEDRFYRSIRGHTFIGDANFAEVAHAFGIKS